MSTTRGSNKLIGWILFLISPEMKPRRVLAPGFQRENLPVWIFLTVLFLLYQFVIAGKTYMLYVPNDIVWGWNEVHLPVLGPLVALGSFAYVTAICLFPRATGALSCIVFSGYFLYGAANDAPVDFLMGFADPLFRFVSPLLPSGSRAAFSWLWNSVHFPAIHYYAFRFYLTLYIFFTGILAFIYFPAREGAPKHRPTAIDILLFVISLIFTINYIVNFGDRGERAGIIVWHDVIMGILAIIVSIEMCRRLLGWILPSLAVVFFLYCLYGNHLSGRLNHAGFAFNEVAYFIFSVDGIYGVIANVYASYVFLFILFGVFLEKTKVGDVFVKLSFALVGRFRGGPAKAAVVSSGLVGMIIGSGAPNIVITGTFTIPMMKRAGFTPYFAGAVEAVSSIGGILMPPVMGSAAFLVAAFTETDYSYIALISFIPAMMYYFQAFMSVHHRSGLRGIYGIPKEELPQLKTVLKEEGYLLLPVLLLILRLIIGRSPFDAALWAIILAMFLGFFRDDTRIIGLPPCIARALGVSGWGTDVDWARLNAERTRVAMIQQNRPAGEIEAEYNRIVEEAEAAPDRGFLQDNWMLVVGLGVFVVLAAMGEGIGFSLFWALMATFVLSSPKVLDGLESGALNSLSIGVTAAVMGIVLAGVSMPGLGLKFPSIVIGYSRILVDTFGWQGTQLPMAIILCGIAAYIMGMGMTISAAYILLSVLAVPALVSLGVPLLSAHLLTLWFTVTAPLTPPFALGAFIAAGMAGADPMRTGFAAVRLAWALYIVPFLIAYTPILMNKDASWADILVTWVTGFMGFYCTAAGFEGFLQRKLKVIERVVFVVAAFLLFADYVWTKILGTCLMAAGMGVQFLWKPSASVELEAAAPEK